MNAVKQMIATLTRELRARRDVRRLKRLDDRMLRDIGLHRCDLEVAARFGRTDIGDAA